MSELILTDANFSDEVLKSQGVILVDFWAVWCVPCQMITPILQEIGGQFGDKIRIGKLNVDENPLVANAFTVNAIPTVMLFKDGKLVQKFVGVQPKEIIAQNVASLLQK